MIWECTLPNNLISLGKVSKSSSKKKFHFYSIAEQSKNLVWLDSKPWQFQERLFLHNQREKSSSMENSTQKLKESSKSFLINIRLKERWARINVINLLWSVLVQLPVPNFMRKKLMDYSGNMMKIRITCLNSKNSLNSTKWPHYRSPQQSGQISGVLEFKGTSSSQTKMMKAFIYKSCQEK